MLPEKLKATSTVVLYGLFSWQAKPGRRRGFSSSGRTSITAPIMRVFSGTARNTEILANGRLLRRSRKTGGIPARLSIQCAGRQDRRAGQGDRRKPVRALPRAGRKRSINQAGNGSLSKANRRFDLKTWPELREIQPRSVTEADCTEWAAGLAKQYSPTRYNNAVDTLRQIFEVATKKGLIYRNPAKDLSKAPVQPKRLELPRREEFTKVVNHVRKNGAWCSEQCGDLIEFLAYSGARLEKARNVR